MPGRAVREQLEGHRPRARLEYRAVRGQLVDGLGGERERGRRPPVADGHRHDLDALGRAAPGVDRRLGDAGHHRQPLRHPPPDGVEAVEAGLGHDADQELEPFAVRIARRPHGRYRARGMPFAAGLGRHEAEAAPAVLVAAGGVGRDGVAALDDAARHHRVEGGAVVGPVVHGLQEQPDVVGRRLGQQIDDEGPRRRFHHRLLAPHLVEAQRGHEQLLRRRARPRQHEQPRRRDWSFHVPLPRRPAATFRAAFSARAQRGTVHHGRPAAGADRLAPAGSPRRRRTGFAPATCGARRRGRPDSRSRRRGGPRWASATRSPPRAAG